MEGKLIAIVGPTASGKTALAQHLASVFGGEIVNADSRQIYKGMDIGTAKLTQPTTNDQRLTTIHLIDVVEPNEEFTVADYKKLAIQTINDITSREKIPFLVGGTGLYIKAIVDNLEFPWVPPQRELRKKLEKKSEGELYEMLKKRDPLTARTIDRYNKRRLMRALEVVFATGESFFGQIKKGPKLYETLQIAIDIPKEKLFQHIETRTQEMIQDGLEREVKTLIKKYGWTNVLSNTIGYKEWKEFFQGMSSKDKVASEIVKNTKLLVKKQLTWFRAQKSIHWVKDEKEAEKAVKKFFKT
ncbi:MAG: tRNA (adenosine(37)-N6)-dimethylallyltransferase MiaA [Candidatus Portnoybacteria bacterium]|nr:tRNA (adenosine(37)-N6)-dimethylallyltransferase MiaA [Candidatus Portnoybacteria bacterium]